MSKPIRIVVADDQALARTTLAYFLNANDDMEVVGEACDGQEAVELARLHQPDVVLMDYAMPRLNGADATSQIAATCPQSRVVGCSHNDSQAIADAMLHAGAVDFVSKRASIPEFIVAIRQAADAHRP